jgi:hypothetical protein
MIGGENIVTLLPGMVNPYPGPLKKTMNETGGGLVAAIGPIQPPWLSPM